MGDMIVWRQFAITGALWSLPFFALSSAFRMPVKFDRDNYDFEAHYHNLTKAHDPPSDVYALGNIMGFLLFMISLFLVFVHWKHGKVFDDRYKFAQNALDHHRQVTNTMK